MAKPRESPPVRALHNFGGMRRPVVSALFIVLIAAAGCSRAPEGFEIPEGTDVSVEKRDGVKVSGKLVDVQPQEVVLESAGGTRTRVPRAEIAKVHATAPKAPTPPAAPAAPAAPDRDDSVKGSARPSTPVAEYREVTVPAGTVLPIELRTAVGSSTSKVEDPVRGTIRRAITIDGLEAIPAGSVVVGTVTEASRSARVKGRARVAFRFSTLDRPTDAERVKIRTASYAREAEGTQKRDAATIGGGAAAGAIIGGIVGGGDGAAKGAAIGGGAGTGVVLSTRGKEVSLPAGTSVSVKLLEPVTVRVRVR
jgi:hypothetical protein